MQVWEVAVWGYCYVTLMLIIFVSVYGIARRPNLLKKVIMLSILTDTANLLAVILGYRAGLPIPPVFPGQTFEVREFPSEAELSGFTARAVDPLPQVLVVTAIVIGLSVLVFLSILTILTYRKFGTLDMRVVSKKAWEVANR